MTFQLKLWRLFKFGGWLMYVICVKGILLPAVNGRFCRAVPVSAEDRR